MSNVPERQLPDPVTGTEPGPGVQADGPELKPHHEYWDRAMDDAIRQIAGKKDWPKPADYDVTITFEATIEVRNPGGVGQYRVTMS